MNKDMNSTEMLNELLYNIKKGYEVEYLEIKEFIDKLKEEINIEQKGKQEQEDPLIGVKIKNIILAGIEEKVGLNPWCINEGLAKADDLYPVPVSIAIKYELI